jgi:glutathione S-transferase
MMILRNTPASPFGRKVRIAVSVLGLDAEIKLQDTDLNDPADTIRIQNPLGKLPALILEDGTTYYDSRVILEYLDHVAGGGRVAIAGAVRRHSRCQHPDRL